MTTYTIGGGGDCGMKYPDITIEELDDKVENLLKQNEDLKHEIEILVDIIRDLQWKLEIK
jgi:prefoldin subunit 5